MLEEKSLPKDIVIQDRQLAIRAGDIIQLFRNIETPWSAQGQVGILIITMNGIEIIMHRAEMEKPQVIITFPVTVRAFHGQSPDMASLSASGDRAWFVCESTLFGVSCLRKARRSIGWWICVRQ